MIEAVRQGNLVQPFVFRQNIAKIPNISLNYQRTIDKK